MCFELRDQSNQNAKHLYAFNVFDVEIGLNQNMTTMHEIRTIGTVKHKTFNYFIRQDLLCLNFGFGFGFNFQLS